MTEHGALLLSAGAALVLGVVGVAAALLTGSGAILLDGLFNLCFFATALLALRVATLVARPDDERYPFGYLFFEPLINTGKGLLILGVSLFALFDAVSAILAGGRVVVVGPAMVYAAVATVACTAVALILRRAARRAPSPLVAADVENWTVNALVSGGVLAGFILATVLARRGHAGAAAYVDPAMVAVVVLVSIAIPVRMAASGLLALLNRAPAPAVVADMEAAVRTSLGDLPVERLWLRAIRPGRTAYIVVHAVLPAGTPLDLAASDRLRGAIIAALAARHGPMVADVIFTEVEAYAAPTAGGTGMTAARQA
ncbi:MAG TPA: cation transporter [Amaricoccus sp.]|nr:cation transporter [Amaricoccus sp.]